MSRLDAEREVKRPPSVAPDATAAPPSDRQATVRPDARRDTIQPPRAAAPTSPPPAPDLPAASRVDARPEAEQPARATPAVTPPPPTSDLSAPETSEPLVRAEHGEEPVPASPPASRAIPEAQEQEVDFPSITNEIMRTSPISPWVLIMHFATDVVGRGILLSVETDGITGHDQFGVSDGAESGDEAVRHIKIPLSEASVFAMVVSRPTTYRGKINPGKWNDYFLETLGGKRPHEVVLIPIALAGKVVAIFYGDDAGTDKPLGDVTPLEAFIGQTFSAIETSLLEKRSKAPT